MWSLVWDGSMFSAMASFRLRSRRRHSPSQVSAFSVFPGVVFVELHLTSCLIRWQGQDTNSLGWHGLSSLQWKGEWHVSEHGWPQLFSLPQSWLQGLLESSHSPGRWQDFW